MLCTVTRTATDVDCDVIDATLLTSPRGVLSSLQSPAQCAWKIRVAPYQRIHVSVIDWTGTTD